MDMDSLLKEMKQRGASDLHLVAGISPMFRIDGDLMREFLPIKKQKIFLAGI